MATSSQRECAEAAASRNPIAVTIVRTRDDLQTALRLRAKGYAKYGDGFEVPEEADLREGTVILLAREEATGKPVGTMRLMDSRYGPLELESYVPMRDILPAEQWPAIEATRFSVPHHPKSFQIKLAMWKCFWLYSLENGLATMAISARRGAAKDYLRLMFRALGPEGDYTHPDLGESLHSTYVFDVQGSLDRYARAGHPLYAFFAAQHANITTR